MSARPRAFVIGQPIAHSRSPLIHRYWLGEYGIRGGYEAIDVAPSALASFLERVRDGEFVGGNVTVPHKEAVFRLMAGRTDGEATAVGAVNTIYRAEDTELTGTNTDIAGFLANLDDGAPGWDGHGEVAVLIGAGGAGRGLAHALRTRGMVLRIVNRTFARAVDLAARVDGAEAVRWDDLASALAGAAILVNATSLGMTGKPPLAIDLSPLPRSAVVNDIVYVPLETPLLAAARRRGNAVVDGLGMLLHQAVPGFARWFGVTPAVTPDLRRRVLADITGRAA